MAGILYEVNTRVWLRELSEKAGRRLTLADVPEDEIRRWRELGFTHIWFMGVWQVGPRAREVALRYWREYWRKEIQSTEEDVQGSPYAIQEYSVDQRLGEALSLLMLKEKLARAGMRLIIDFVPNHFGLDSSEPQRFPARFVHSMEPKPGTFESDARFAKRYFAHGKDPFFPPWTDTVQLDYRVAPTHDAMRATAQTVSMYGDGLRCDMAMLLLPEIFQQTWKEFPCHGAHQTNASFWRKTIAAVRQLQPQAELIAEAYWDREEELQGAGFDYTYNKRVFDYTMRGQYRELSEFLRAKTDHYLRHSVHFLENHDEPRVASALPPGKHKIAAALMFFLPGMALLHDGQLEGRKECSRIQVAKRPEEQPNEDILNFYESLLKDLQKTQVRRGKASMVRFRESGSVVAVKWVGPNRQTDLAVVNPGEQEEVAILVDDHFPSEVETLYSTSERPLRIIPGGESLVVPPQSAFIARLPG